MVRARAIAAASLVLLCTALWLSSVAAAEAPPAGPTFEISTPDGRSPKGWVVLIHGGGFDLPPPAMGFEFPARNRFLSWGWATLNVGYRPNRLSLTDSLAMYDWLRRRVGSRTRICVEGASAGGFLALMLAIRRPTVACAISMAGPTDFVTRGNPLTPLVRKIFGGPLRKWSPSRLAFSAPTVASCARNDPLVPCGQVSALAKHHRNVQPVYLSPGSEFLVHTQVDSREVAALFDRHRRLLERTLRRGKR